MEIFISSISANKNPCSTSTGTTRDGSKRISIIGAATITNPKPVVPWIIAEKNTATPAKIIKFISGID